MTFSDYSSALASSDNARRAIELLSSGGDARITLDPESGLNRYMSAPYPRDVLAYASSTANDASADAFAQVVARLDEGLPGYDSFLDTMRGRIRRAYDVPDGCGVVFAASGTDLEYVALAAVAGRSAAGLHNILLGADEVGSGCIHSAHGDYFAEQTALGIPSTVAEKVPGLEHVTLVDIPVRSDDGLARTGREIEQSIDEAVATAQAQGLHTLVHVVHGSKTGLILPDLDGIDRLQARWGDSLTFVVDACQARITTAALADYLQRGALVFLTGSKFMGGPPFSGFALVPEVLMQKAGAVPAGLATIFNRAEWPLDWPGRNALPDGENPGLMLRLEASIFELERFQRLPMASVERVIDGFERALTAALLDPLGLSLVRPFAPGESAEAISHPIEMRTLATLDVSSHPAARTFDDAQQLHRTLAMGGVRLGQPVKCVRLPGGGWGGTLRIGMSMPQMSLISQLDDAALEARFVNDMGRIAAALPA